VMAQVMMTLFLDFFMGLGLRACACVLDGFHGPGCLLRVWAILSHARGPCHLNRNNQLIGFPVLRCSDAGRQRCARALTGLQFAYAGTPVPTAIRSRRSRLPCLISRPSARCGPCSPGAARSA
jgi:hypothetical protein